MRVEVSHCGGTQGVGGDGETNIWLKLQMRLLIFNTFSLSCGEFGMATVFKDMFESSSIEHEQDVQEYGGSERDAEALP